MFTPSCLIVATFSSFQHFFTQLKMICSLDSCSPASSILFKLVGCLVAYLLYAVFMDENWDSQLRFLIKTKWQNYESLVFDKTKMTKCFRAASSIMSVLPNLGFGKLNLKFVLQSRALSSTRNVVMDVGFGELTRKQVFYSQEKWETEWVNRKSAKAQKATQTSQKRKGHSTNILEVRTNFKMQRNNAFPQQEVSPK